MESARETVVCNRSFAAACDISTPQNNEETMTDDAQIQTAAITPPTGRARLAPSL